MTDEHESAGGKPADAPDIDPRLIKVGRTTEKPETLSSGLSKVQPESVTASASSQHPLRKFSLRGKTDVLAARAAVTTPLLGDFVMRGQATMIYAAPNTGKTLIVLRLLLQAIKEGHVDPDKVFYVNADDNSEGLHIKNQLLQDAGAHMVVPGL